jgi:hypothetical protein
VTANDGNNPGGCGLIRSSRCREVLCLLYRNELVEADVFSVSL